MQALPSARNEVTILNAGIGMEIVPFHLGSMSRVLVVATSLKALHKKEFSFRIVNVCDIHSRDFRESFSNTQYNLHDLNYWYLYQVQVLQPWHRWSSLKAHLRKKPHRGNCRKQCPEFEKYSFNEKEGEKTL